ncbi:MAG: type II 3-dehydroquinate dehydratase [Gemmatimonadetes bacterium]|nr:type II 3-dehydroquinate dehydratase [Gemmatimonadota bacterium]
MRIAVVHGPNLDLLGHREPSIYGRTSLADINGQLGELATALGVELEVLQSNAEGDLIDYIHEAAARVDGFLVNAAGLTHTSVALLDALLAVDRPYVEVHLSNPAGRERFRRRSLLAPRARGVVQGFGAESYLLGLRGLVRVVCEGAHEQRGA